jgi:AcrR family transcriptional regulator
MPTRAYRPRARSTGTRDRIMRAVHDLLAEGTFHESTVEQVAERAGISRATLYQHFGSRLDLVDGVCDWLGDNPALLEIRASIGLPDPTEALAQALVHTVRFWSSEDAILGQLYGVVALDPAASAFVDRQRADRRGEIRRLADRLEADDAGFALLMVLTSYEAFGELRRAGLDDAAITAALQDSARELLRA